MTDSLQENLSLFEVNRQLLQEMKVISQQQLQMLQQNDTMITELTKLVYLLNGFSSGGTPARSYTPDHMLTAYLALVGPALGGRISKENADPNEVLKASIIIARDLLQELSAYNESPVAAQSTIEKAFQGAENPWEDDDEDPA